MITTEENKVKEHMKKSHNIKVELDLLSRKFPCTLCSFTTRSMEYLKKHLIGNHNKESHNWMVEDIKAEFNCDECDLKFSRKSELESHMNMKHAGDKGVGAIEDILKVKVETDDRQNAKRKFTSTTADLPTIDEENDFCEVKQETVKTEEHKDYTKTIHNVEEPKLITIRGISRAFLDARRRIAKILRRGNLQTAGLKVNGIQFKVLNMQDKHFP